jgi:type I restriction enzyme M protein
MSGLQDKVAFIWSVADLLRGDYKPAEYGRVILPLVTLRRLDCVLALDKATVLTEYEKLKDTIHDVEPVLAHIVGQSFFNRSRLDFPTLLADPAQIAGNLRSYINGFSRQTITCAITDARDIREVQVRGADWPSRRRA